MKNIITVLFENTRVAKGTPYSAPLYMPLIFAVPVMLFFLVAVSPAIPFYVLYKIVTNIYEKTI